MRKGATWVGRSFRLKRLIAMGIAAFGSRLLRIARESGWRAADLKTILPGLRGCVGGFAGVDEVAQFL